MAGELCHHRSGGVAARLRRLPVRLQFPHLNRGVDAALAGGDVTAASGVRDRRHRLPGRVEQERLRHPLRVEQDDRAAAQIGQIERRGDMRVNCMPR